MGFEFKHGNVSQAVALGQAAGAGERRRTQEANALRFAMQVKAQQHAIKMAEMRMDMSFQSAVRQQEFDLNKINIRQENDFMMSEKVRMDRVQFEEGKRMHEEQVRAAKVEAEKTEYEATVKFINSQDNHSESEKRRAIIKLRTGLSPSAYEDETDVEASREERAQGHYTMAQERHRMSMEPDVPTEMEQGRYQMSQERHQQAMQPDEPKVDSFSKRMSAMKYIEDEAARKEEEDAWNAWGQYEQTPLQEQMLAEANRIATGAQMLPDVNTPPTSLVQMSKTVKQLNLVDPAKAQAYYDKYISMFKD